MRQWPFPRARYIQRDNDLHELVSKLQHEPLLAIDTESNSLYAYREQVCLVQLSTRSADFIIDPLTIKNMAPLGELLANPAIEKVFHAAEYDLICLKRDYGFGLVNLFDTMVAARICGHKLIGLGNLLETHIGVKIDKSHQRDNWGQRPLPLDSLLYAQMDTHYLPMVRDHLYAELESSGRLIEAREAFGELCDVTVPLLEFDPEGYWRIGLPNQLSRRQMAVLRELYLLREHLARERDVPPFKVLTDKTLAALAQMIPVTAADLSSITGISPSVMRRYGDALLDAISRGTRADLPSPPTRQQPAPPEVVDLYTLLREWRKTRAQQRGVESDVIISKEALWLLAERRPETLDDMRDVPGLGPWRLETYGEELLQLIQRFNNMHR